jgi:dTDP-glucose 4,6-dehydratase/UDP-glucuronate decarboxylase
MPEKWIGPFSGKFAGDLVSRHSNPCKSSYGGGDMIDTICQIDKIIYHDVKGILNDVNLKDLAGKTILITGASGMLGTYILSCLKVFNDQHNAGIMIIAVIHRDLPRHLVWAAECDFINIISGDLTDIDFCRNLPYSDIVFHLACYAQPSKYIHDMSRTIKLNTLTTLALLEKMKPGGKFLFFSSLAVYVGCNGVMDESADVYKVKKEDDPRECYYRGKKAGEYICETYSLMAGKDIKSIRIGVSYGPGTRVDDDKALSDFINKAQDGRIELRDKGVDLQHYCYVADMIKMVFLAFFFGKERLYNIGNPDRVSIMEVAQTVGNIMSVEVAVPPNANEIQISSHVDVSRFIKEFPDMKFISLGEGIKRTVEWKRLIGHIPPHHTHDIGIFKETRRCFESVRRSSVRAVTGAAA